MAQNPDIDDLDFDERLGCWVSQVEDSDASLGDSCENMLLGSSKKAMWKDGYMER